MTISKERLEQIVLSIYDSNSDFQFTQPSLFREFAHALLKKVEAESEVVAYYDPSEDESDMAFMWPCNHCHDDPQDTKLIALPLVEGD